MKWFVQIYRDDNNYPTKEFYLLLRAHTWQDAYDSLPKEQFKRYVWSLRPLEVDGTYFDSRRFKPVDESTLKEAGFIPKKRED